MKEKQTILIVEDEAVNRRILRKILEDSYNIVEAENGKIAFDILMESKVKISAVLLDVIMPVMTGFEFLKNLKDSNIDNLPIIVTTGTSDIEAEQNALDMGAWDFISKPYVPKVLKSRLRNAIARSQVEIYKEMNHMTEHDRLTGLHNRAKMFSNTKKMFNQNPDEKFAFVRIDIDRFALFNTSFGERQGDALLKYMSECITTFAESFEFKTYGRMNADVFCVCFNYDENEENLRKKIHIIQRELAEFRKDYLIEISAGICIVDDLKLSIDELYFRASTAAQKCKNQYDTHLSFYDKESGKIIATVIEITNEMQAALDNGQFVVYLQPKFNLSTENICGAEALVRWVHPIKGLISPGEFIPVFEKNGFISKLDYYVWEKTCAMIKKWIDDDKKVYPVSVNISRISLYNPNINELLCELVAKYDIPPHLLELEITESAYMSNPEVMENTIASFHQSGFVILMDDFGSGYSSLNTLKQIRVDVLKIDMRFLPLGDDAERAEIILASIIKMAKWLGMSVTTEGVETRRQRDFLEGAGCDNVQGYLYSRPIPQSEYEEKYIVNNSSNDDENNTIYVSDSTPLYNITMLVIDDNEIDCTLLSTYFSELYNIKCVDTAEAGLAYLKKNKNNVKVVLVDNILPGMNGVEFLRYCKSDKYLKSIPKIMITATNLQDTQVQAFNEGAYDFIQKPLIREVVLARVNHIMEQSKKTSIFDVVENDYKLRSERDIQTGLLNKMAFRELTTRIVDALPDEEAALLVIDIDDFKSINDTYGHLIGDQVITLVANELSNTFRKTDFVGRFGGDEFVILMSQLPNRQIAKRKAMEIIKSIIFSCSKKLKLKCSISIGISFSKLDDTIDTLFARADQALYEAKNTGKSKFVIYGETVPPILDDNKPIVLICGDDPQLFPSIALAYGDTASFASIDSFDALKENFEKYGKRIKAICLDMQKRVINDSDEFYQYILSKGGGKNIPILAICKEGNMEHLRHALKLDIIDLITIPIQMDNVQRRLSYAIIHSQFKD